MDGCPLGAGVTSGMAGARVGLIPGAVNGLRAHVSQSPVQGIRDLDLCQSQQVGRVRLSLQPGSDTEHEQGSGSHIDPSILPLTSTCCSCVYVKKCKVA